MEAHKSPSGRSLTGVREDFGALFAMLDQPVDQGAAHAGYAQLLTRIASPSFRRECLKKTD